MIYNLAILMIIAPPGQTQLGQQVSCRCSSVVSSETFATSSRVSLDSPSPFVFHCHINLTKLYRVPQKSSQENLRACWENRS